MKAFNLNNFQVLWIRSAVLTGNWISHSEISVKLNIGTFENKLWTFYVSCTVGWMTCSWLYWWMKANNANERIGQHGILKTALWDKMLWFIEVVQSLRLLILVKNIIKWNLKAFSFVTNFMKHKLILVWVIRLRSFVKISTSLVIERIFSNKSLSFKLFYAN